ncbi:MAG: hypothetical protein WCD37_06360 [Chloroflexia bacterium]
MNQNNPSVRVPPLPPSTQDSYFDADSHRPADAKAAVEWDIERAKSKLERFRNRFKFRLLIFIVIIIAILVGGNILIAFILGQFGQDVFSWIAEWPWYVAISLVLGVLYFLFTMVLARNREASLEDELDVLLTRKRFMDRADIAGTSVSSTGASGADTSPLTPSIPESDTSKYFNSLVQINILNLGEYYTLVKTHTDKSYQASTRVGAIGFGFIIAGLTVGLGASLFGKPDTQIIAYITSASGVITEFIAGVFFYLYNKTVRELKKYHDSLLEVQNILLSFKIVGDTSDPKEKATMVAQMITALLAIKHADK